MNARPPRAAGPFGAGDELDEEPFGPNGDIGEIAYQNARQENGRIVDGTVYEGQHDEEMEREHAQDERRAIRNQYFARAENLDADMLESPRTRRQRYLDSEMEEVSEPDEWAEVHYGHMGQLNFERMTRLFQSEPTTFGTSNRDSAVETCPR